MFIDSNGMAIRRHIPDIVDNMEICNTKTDYNPSPSTERKPSTTLADEGTKGCHEEIVVEKHAPRHAFSEQRVAQTECTYSDFTLAAERDLELVAIREKEKPSNEPLSTLGEKAIVKTQRALELVDGEATAQGEWPWKPPDQSNDASHHFRPLNTAARRIEDSPVGILNELVVGGNGTKKAVHQFDPRWAHYETQFTLMNDDTRRLSKERRWQVFSHHVAAPKWIDLPIGRGRRGGGSHRKNERRWTFVPEQLGVLDVLASSSDPQNLSNNKVCCLQRQQGVFDVLTASWIHEICRATNFVVQNRKQSVNDERCSLHRSQQYRWTTYLFPHAKRA
jgi:hypothetical protein